MATSAKRKNPEHLELLENSELEVMRAKIRKLEQKNFELEATVKANEELQMIKNDQVDHHEIQENDVRFFKLTPDSGVDHGYDEVGDQCFRNSIDENRIESGMSGFKTPYG